MCRNDLYFLLTQVLKLTYGGRLDPVFHRWFCNELSVDVSTLYLLPRDHTKSVTGVVVKTVQDILKNPSVSILIASRTIERAKNNLYEIRKHLSNPILIYCFPDILWEDIDRAVRSGETTWSAEKIIVKRSVIRSDATVWIAGLGKTITGAHPDIANLDDIINEENVLTEEQRDKVLRWYIYLQPILSVNCIVRVFGTRYDEYDLYGYIIDQINENKLNWRVVQRAVIENGKFIYSYYNEQLLEEKRSQMNEYAFRCQYYNNVITDAERVFPTSLIKSYDELEGKLEDYEWILTIDPSFSTAKKSDNIGFVLCGYDKNNNVWVEKAVRYKLSVVELLHKIYDYNAIYPLTNVGIERGTWQGAIQDMFQYIIASEGLPMIPITDIPLTYEPDAKNNRIIALTAYFEKGIIHLKSDVYDEESGEIKEKNTYDLKQEMYYYSTSTKQKIDVLDALSMQPKCHIWGNEYRGDASRFGTGTPTYRDVLFGKKRVKGYGFY